MISMKELEKEMAVVAQADLSQEKVGGVPIIRTRGKKFRINDEEIKGGRLECVVLATSFLNAWYKDDYDPDNPTNPDCAAIGSVELEKKNELKPVESPLKQAEACAVCPKAQFGSADKGRGKACRNMRRLVLVAANDKRPEPQLLVLQIPPTGLTKFGQYVNKYLTITNRPLAGFITTFTLADDQDWPVPVPEFTGLINEPARLKQMLDLAKSKQVQEIVMQAPIVGNSGDKPKPKKADGAKSKQRLKGKR